MRSIENTAVNDLIARASGRRPSASMAMVDDDADGDPDPDAAQLTLPIAMPVAAPFEARRATSSYPVVHRGPAVATSPEWPSATAPEFLEPASPRRLYELASRVEQGETGGGAPRWTDHERMVPTFQMRRPSEVRSVVARLVFPVALLVSIGVVVGAYVAFSGDRGDVASAASAGAPPEAPAAAPAAPTPAPARTAPTVTAALPEATAPAAPSAPGTQAAAPAAPSAPDPAAAGAAPASPELVDVRIDSMPAGATVMLVDRGRAQLIGDTPVDTAVDPSREYDLVFTSAGAPPQVEHLDPRTTRRVEVALGKRDGAEHAADAPRRVEHAPAEHAPAEHAAEHAPAEHAPAEHAPAEHAPAEHAPAEHAPARPGRSRPEPRAETRSEPPSGQGTLMISSKPPCEIVIDGRATGLTTPQRSIALSAGTHRITLLNSEKSIRKVVSVQIIADTTAKIIEDLMP
jgi:hypothetical protein